MDMKSRYKKDCGAIDIQKKFAMCTYAHERKEEKKSGPRNARPTSRILRAKTCGNRMEEKYQLLMAGLPVIGSPNFKPARSLPLCIHKTHTTFIRKRLTTFRRSHITPDINRTTVPREGSSTRQRPPVGYS